MKDFASKEEVVKHLSHIKSTIGIDLDNPYSGVISDYTITLYYLGNIVYFLNTKPFDIKIDDLWKEEKENENKG